MQLLSRFERINKGRYLTFVRISVNLFRILLQLRDDANSLYQVNFKFGFLDCVCCIADFIIPRFVISGFCSIHFTVTLGGLTNIYKR